MINTSSNIPENKVWRLLEAVCDPEIPFLNVVEMGVVRDVSMNEDGVMITITPTYSGCPAMRTIELDIEEVLKKNSITSYKVKTILSPAWTTDWMTDEAREKLRKEGIAPPQKGSTDKGLLMGRIRNVQCPCCHSENTEMISQFGSTACKSLYKCKNCQEPFDYFKCI